MPQATPVPAPALPARPARPVVPPGVIFDSDMGANIDSALALGLLYGAATKVKVIGLSITNTTLESASYCDILARFYASSGRLNNAPPHFYAPVGFAGDGKKHATEAMITGPLGMKNAEGKSLYGDEVRDILDTAEVGVVFRNALLSQKDGEGVVMVAGPATNLVRALAVPGNRDLIAAKVGLLVAAFGAFGESGVDPRVKADIAAARRVAAEWPGPIVFVGREVGTAVPYPAASIAADFDWSPSHPIVAAYKAAKAMPYDAPSQAVVAALYATGSGEDLLRLSEPGKVTISEDGRCAFAVSAGGHHRYILAESDAGRKARLTQAFVSAVSAKPAAAGTGRGRGQQQNAQAPAVVPKP